MSETEIEKINKARKSISKNLWDRVSTYIIIF
jgi:hypothetical protein